MIRNPIIAGMNYTKKKSAVLYHYPCPDGTFAALAAHLYFSATSSPVVFFPNTVYSPIKADQLPLQEIGDVYLLDFVGPSGFVTDLSSKVDNVIILDHHKTALETLGGETSLSENITKVLDMERSGATIAYDYFKQKLSEESKTRYESVLAEFERMRKIFEYIEDADLWKWRLEKSKAFSSGLKDQKLEFDFQKNPSVFRQLLSLDLDSVINQGIISLNHKQKLITEALEKSYAINLGGGEFGCCLAVNADEALSELRSELGNQLAFKSQERNLRGVGAIVYRVPELGNDQMLKISLRSVKSEDTTPISEKYGGGGHRNASSFLLKLADFEAWKINI
ncbi:hypothetical protein SOVF_003090 [Spinacia oleracea]|uniref:Uncharacterized protein LOC110798130 n=1 Tax=Spinacia oleracea TaxID=3562 RepID=A0A9R0K570_SPIOL|nr:uncharacterized protein LOC110798130 [Spinacia oleracea]XP_021858972.1 uncharacterized protein LOC110798130 [Spinacia oleracea]KNA25806.1 hypothetical protein SOVF_003090 [Spinacia oleracea]